MPTETKKSKMTDQEYFELFANICTNSYSEEKSVNNPLNEDWQKLKLVIGGIKTENVYYDYSM